MPCIVDINDGDMSNHWEILLCKACKYLTVEQIKSLKNPGSGIMDGIEWYAQHLFHDATFSENTTYEKLNALTELKRIGYEIKRDDLGGALINTRPV